MANDIQYVPPLGKSDHTCMVFNTNMLSPSWTGLLYTGRQHMGLKKLK